MSKEPKILFYDIETKPLEAYIWGLGEQHVRHNQLKKNSAYDIISISYVFNKNKKVKSLDWGYEEQNSKPMIEAFDAIVKTADVVIGKNSDRFDIRHINTQRWLKGLPAFPDWCVVRDDLEKQIRRYMVLPSFSLDYVSKIRGFGGKRKMEFDDWVNIVEKTPILGPKCFKKMITYGNKDVDDTRNLWYDILEHIKPKFNVSMLMNGGNSCPQCGSNNKIKNGSHATNTGVKAKYRCTDCGRSYTQATKTRTGF